MFMPRKGLIAGSMLLLAAVLAGCSDQAIMTPASVAAGARSNLLVMTPTTWDFASLLPAGDPATDLGFSHVFTITGVGSITASSDNPGHHVTDKDQGGSERGLGICNTAITPCDNDEIGTASVGGHLDLNFAALPAGTTVTDLSFGSVQVGEGVAFAISTDGGVTFGTPTNIVPNPATPGDILPFHFGSPLSTTNLVIRFTTASGAAPDVDNDYTVINVTTVNTVNVGTTWCSPGFWKKHTDLWTGSQGNLYSSLGSGAAPLSKKAPPGDPNLLTVISNPNTYGGPATNSVADFLSNLAFGTPIGSGIEDDNACDAFAKGPGIPSA